MPLPPGRTGLPIVGETFEFLRDGFGFIDRRVAAHGPVFQTSVLGKPTACIVGPDACAVWIDPDLLCRDGAQPPPIFAIFAGPSLPHLDADALRARKALVLAAFTRDAIASYLPGLETCIETALSRWSRMGEFSWIPEMKRLAVEGICRNFFGDAAIASRLAQVVGDYDTVTKGIGALPLPIPGTSFGRAIAARDRLLAFLREEIRSHRAARPAGAADGLARILAAGGSGPDGPGITDDAAMREMHHVVIAGYIIFAEFARIAVEIHRRPDVRRRLEEEAALAGVRRPFSIETLDAMPYLSQFVMEVKRHVPILPAIFARARRDFDFQGATIPRGWMVLWGLRATLMDPSIYTRPEVFDPDRFGPGRAEHLKHEHAFVPQGPGPAATSHKCPGTEYATVFMKVFTLLLLRCGRAWDLAKRDVAYDWSLTPPEPREGLRVRFEES